MWDVIVLIPDHCLSIYLSPVSLLFVKICCPSFPLMFGISFGF